MVTVKHILWRMQIRLICNVRHSNAYYIVLTMLYLHRISTVIRSKHTMGCGIFRHICKCQRAEILLVVATINVLAQRSSTGRGIAVRLPGCRFEGRQSRRSRERFGCVRRMCCLDAVPRCPTMGVGDRRVLLSLVLSLRVSLRRPPFPIRTAGRRRPPAVKPWCWLAIMSESINAVGS